MQQARSRGRASAPVKAGKLTAVVVILALAIPLFVLCFVPGSLVQRGFLALLAFIERDATSKTLGGALFVAFYTVTMALGLPGTPLNLAAGYIFGTIMGTTVSAAGITLGAVAAFFLGRTLVREWAEAKIAASVKFRAMDRAVKEKGLLLVFLIRLSPVMPFGLCCYLLGATKIAPVVYTVATFGGLLPGTAAYCYLGSLMGDLSSMWQNGSARSTSKIVWIVVGAVTTILLVVVVTLVAKRAVDKEMRKQRQTEEDESSAESRPSTDVEEESPRPCVPLVAIPSPDSETLRPKTVELPLLSTSMSPVSDCSPDDQSQRLRQSHPTFEGAALLH